MIEIHQEADVHCSAEATFAAIVDLRDYNRWLTRSSACPGTTDISTDPITAGTTYVESGPQGPLKPVRPLVLRQFRRESERTLLALKAHAEALATRRG